MESALMKDREIQAILSGQKKTMRIVVKPQPRNVCLREILFRGKRLNFDGWAHGDLSYQVHNGKVYVFPKGRYDISDFYEVDPATVGQNTGLTDKNGVKIFEGDICRCEMMNDDGKIYDAGVYVVEWYKENAMFTLISQNEELEFGFLSGYEVIGNIHDNPELLEVGP